MKQGCFAKGCDQSADGGWIDFGRMYGKEFDYCRTQWCKKHFEPLMNRVKELIEKDRKSGKLKKNSFYAVVPPHITEQVLKIEG